MNFNQKTIIFFLLALAAGYAVSIGLMVGLLNTPLRLYGWWNLTLVALLVAALLIIWLDRPFELGFFKWPARKPKEAKPRVLRAEEIRANEVMLPVEQPQLRQGFLFPHELPSEHWNADFGDGNQVYQGADLPLWILAGWAVFIIWAIAYLYSGLTVF